MENKASSGISMKEINDAFRDCPDIIRKRVYIDNQYEAYFIFVRELTDNDLIHRDFIIPLAAMNLQQLSNEMNIYNIPCGEMRLLFDPPSVIQSVLSGDTVFVCDRLPFSISCTLTDIEERAIEEPVTEKNIRGPHEGFVEPLYTNLSMLRRKIKNNKLKFKMLKLGAQTSQNIVIAYIEGIVNMEIVTALIDKISNINMDALSNTEYIEQNVIDHPNTVFPQFLSTERPDKAMAALLEGRIVILEDGTPRALIAPVSFLAFFQALDDYSTMWIPGSFFRLIRFIAFLIATLLPSLYISIVSFHYYAVPLAESRIRVPFPPIIEALILEFTIELVREAAICLPTYMAHSGTIDPTTPMLRYDREKIEISGSALFSGDKMVGKIDIQETGLLKGLMGDKGDIHYLYQGEYAEIEEYIKNGAAILLNIKKRDVKIDFKDDKPIIDIELNFDASIGEYPGDLDLTNPEEKKKLEKAVAEDIERDCLKLLKELVDVESDPIGFGEIVRSKHNKQWKSINWKESYKEASFNVKVELLFEFYGAISNQ